MAQRVVSTVTLVAGSLFAACTDNLVKSSPLAPRFDVLPSQTVSGSVLGPDGSSVCNFVPPGEELVVRLIDLPNAQGSVPPEFLFCPANNYAIAAPPGTYLVRAQLPAIDPGLGLLPWRTLDPTPFVVGAAAVTRDIQVQPGTGLGGRSTLDGAPIPGVDLSVVYNQAPFFAASLGTSGASGSWVEFFGRDPLVLQNGIRYQVIQSCDALGTITVEGPPAAPFLFPSEVSAVNCTLVTAPSVRFSHDRTRVVVTPMPGDIGGLSPELPQFGEGWGVQFPVAPGSAPAHASISLSQLFRGGLIVGMRPDRVLTGVDLEGYAECGVCRDLGLDGKVSFAASPQFGKKVLWRYSDATSSEGVGLKVLQKSYDGVPPSDYVLFRFIFTNSGPATITFYAGIFADWDIGDDPFDDVGATELDGRLMYMTDATPGGVFAGTLLLGAPVSGNAVLTDFGQSTATQVAALAGDFTIPAALDPGDHRYIHALGPIILKRGAVGAIWAAVVAGETRDQLLANAAAAAADVAKRGEDMSGDAGVVSALPTATVVAQGTKAHDPRCKKSCAR